MLLGNGGTTCFWDAATFGLIEEQSQHLSFGEFSSKFAAAAAAAPHLKDPQVIASEPGTHPLPVADGTVDLYALTHNETSTGVAMEIRRPDGAAAPADGGGLVAVDATSGAGGLRVDPAAVRRLLPGPPEVLRLRRRAVAGPAARRPPSSGSSGSRPRGAGSRPSWT